MLWCSRYITLWPSYMHHFYYIFIVKSFLVCFHSGKCCLLIRNELEGTLIFSFNWAFQGCSSTIKNEEPKLWQYFTKCQCHWALMFTRITLIPECFEPCWRRLLCCVQTGSVCLYLEASFIACNWTDSRSVGPQLWQKHLPGHRLWLIALKVQSSFKQTCHNICIVIYCINCSMVHW